MVYILGTTTVATVIPPLDLVSVVAALVTVAVELLDQLDEAEEQPFDALLIPPSGGVFLTSSAVVA